jgi:hypothetical protein
MRKTIAAALLLGLFGAVTLAAAQEPSKVELYGGYYYVRFNVNADVPGVPPSQTFNASGGGGQIEYNINNWLGAVGDLAGYGATSTVNGALVGGAFTYLFGPRVNLRRGKITPFAQALFGGIATTSGIGQSGPVNNFAFDSRRRHRFQSVAARFCASAAGRVSDDGAAQRPQRPGEQSSDWSRRCPAPGRKIILRTVGCYIPLLHPLDQPRIRS